MTNTPSRVHLPSTSSSDYSELACSFSSQDTITTIDIPNSDNNGQSHNIDLLNPTITSEEEEDEQKRKAETEENFYNIFQKIIKSSKLSYRNRIISVRVLIAVIFCSCFYTAAERIGFTSDTTSPTDDDPTSLIYKAGKTSGTLNSRMIKSYEDLINIPDYPKTLEIISLTSPLEVKPTTKGKGYVGRVNELKVTGSITEEWLEYLVSIFFPNVHSVHINIDGLCQGSNKKDRNQLQALNLTRVLNLSIEDSHMCSIIDWVFKWKLPELKILMLRRVDFSRKSFKAFCSFLSNNQEKIEKVEMEDCNLCEACETNQIPEGIRNGKLVVKKSSIEKQQLKQLSA